VLRLDARDRVGNAGTATIAFTTDNTRPVLRVEAPATVLAGHVLRATANTSDSGSGLAQPPSWTLGDGSSAVRMQVQHRYSHPGRYTLTVSASDRAGNSASASAAVRVVSLLISPGTGSRPAIRVQLARPGRVRVKLGGVLLRTVHVGRAPRAILLGSLPRGAHRVTVIAGSAQATRLVRVP
jgi:hypothetical protein